MKISGRAILGLPVVTKSGLKLGRISDFEVQLDGQIIDTYLVRPTRLTARLTRDALRIHRTQVVSLDDQRMVVDDGLATVAEKDVAPPIPA